MMKVKHNLWISGPIKSTIVLICYLALTISVNNAEGKDGNPTPVHLDLGEEITFYSDNLAEQRSFYLRLPQHYHQTKRTYPVIYLLDANNETLTYLDNLYFYSVTQITRLIEQGDIPPSIIVGIPFTHAQWINNVISQADVFRRYVTEELSAYITKHYRTSSSSLLVGQSYSAVFVANTLAEDTDSFSGYAAIDPILGSGELERSLQRFQGSTTKNTQVQVLVSNGDIMQHEANTLFQQMTHWMGDKGTAHLKTFEGETHQSIYYPALNHALRTFFNDYRRPDKSLILSPNFNHDALLQYFEARSSKYQVESSDTLVQSALYDSIVQLLIAKKFEQAFALWPKWDSPFKLYHADRIINYFKSKQDVASSIAFMHQLVRAMPDAIVVLDHLSIAYQDQGLANESNTYRLKIDHQLAQMLSKPLASEQERQLNSYGYHLLAQNRHAEAIHLFERVVQAAPQSINAYDSLADAYSINQYYPKAIEALEKAYALATKQNPEQAIAIQQKLKNLRTQEKADE